MKISASGYITLIIVAGFFLIAYLFVAAPLSAENELPLILAAIAGLVAVISKQGQTDNAVAETKDVALQAQVAARASIAVSQENAQSIAASSVQTNQGLNGVNAKVDGHLTALMATIAALTLKVSNLEQAKAIAQIEAVHAESNTSQILTAIAAIPAVVVPAEVVPPPAGAQLGDHQ